MELLFVYRQKKSQLMILICASILGFITNRLRVKTSSIILLLNLMNNQTGQINRTQTKVGQ